MLPSVPTLAKPWPEGEEHASLECIMTIRCTKSAWLNFIDPSLAAYSNFLSCSGYANNNFFNNLGSAASATLYRDASHEVLLLNTRTGAIRNAPWVSLRTPGGCVYFANLITGQTRWLPPAGWMQEWRARIYCPLGTPTQDACNDDALSIEWHSERAYDERSGLMYLGTEGRRHVEGGAKRVPDHHLVRESDPVIVLDGQVAPATFNTALTAVAASVLLGASVAVVATLAALGTVVATATIATVIDAAVFAAAFNAVVAAASTAVVTVSTAGSTAVIAISVVVAAAVDAAAFAAAVDAAAFAAAVAFAAAAALTAAVCFDRKGVAPTPKRANKEGAATADSGATDAAQDASSRAAPRSAATRSSLNESNGIPRRSLSTPRAPGSLARLVVLASLPVFGDCDLITWPATESGPDATLSQALVVPLFLTAAALAILLAMVVLSKLWASRYGSYIDLDSPAHVEGAGIEDMDNAFWHITRAVITLLRAGMPGDVPDTSTTSKGGMTRARKHLRDMGIPFDVMTPQQIKCASWLLLYAGTRSPVSGVASRRHAFGLIRHQIDTVRSHNVPYGNAILPLVPGFASAVMLGRTSYSAAFNDGNLIRRAYARLWISCMLLGDSPPPHDVAVWAPEMQ